MQDPESTQEENIDIDKFIENAPEKLDIDSIDSEMINKLELSGRGIKIDNIIQEKDLNLQKFWEEFLEKYVKTYQYSQLTDEWRPEDANAKYGGLDFKNKEITSLIRTTGWELIKSIGKKIISGDFNLTTVSMPIKVMLPVTILQTIAKSLFNYPYFLNIAHLKSDPIEKIKYVIVASMSCFHRSSVFLKPVNYLFNNCSLTLYWERPMKWFGRMDLKFTLSKCPTTPLFPLILCLDLITTINTMAIQISLLVHG